MMLKNQLRLIVLKKLDDKSLSGYDLIKEIYTSTGTWKPSFGSMYPLLKDLHSKKLLTVKTINRRKVYSITALGKKTLKEALKASQNTIEAMAQEFRLMENICSEHEKKHLDIIIKKIHGDKSIFGGLTEEMDRFQRAMIHIISDDKFKTKEKEIKKILEETTMQLKKI